MNILMIAGTVGRDAELRTTGGGQDILGFSVAVDQGKDQNGNKRDALWVDCSIWGKRARSLESYIKKGTKLTLQGRPTVREHNGKAYLGMMVNDFTFQGGGHQQDQRLQRQEPQGDRMGDGSRHPLEDDIPFAPQVL